MRWREEFQYRGAVIGGILCQIFFGLVLISVYRAMYESRPQTLPLENVVTYVWLQQAFFRMLFASDGELADKIRSGGIAYDLCRPLDAYGYYYVRGMAQRSVGSMLRCIPMLAVAVLLPAGWGLRAPASLPALIYAFISLLFGLLCVCAVDSIGNGFTIRTLDPRGIRTVIEMLMMSFSGNVLPLTLFPDTWQYVIRLLPFAQLLDAPIRIYTGAAALNEIAGIWAVQLGWTALLILTGRALWRGNRKRLVLQGG